MKTSRASSIVAATALVAATLALPRCGGAGGVAEVLQVPPSECPEARYSRQPWDRGMRPPGATERPGDTPQPRCPE